MSLGRTECERVGHRGTHTQLRDTHTLANGESVRTQFELKLDKEMLESKRNEQRTSCTLWVWVVVVVVVMGCEERGRY